MFIQQVFAETEVALNSSASGTIQNLITLAATIAAGVIAMFLIWSIAKEGIAYAKNGQGGSILSIVSKIITLIVLIGLIFLTQGSWKELGKKGQSIGNGALDILEQGAQDIVKPTGGQ